MTNRWWIALVLLVGVLIGVSLTGWHVLPAKEVAARATCADCHDLHGAIEWADAPFQSQLWVLGDVPRSTYYLVNELFPYRNDTSGSKLTLTELLRRSGVEEFAQVALQSLDGGLVILDRPYVTDESVLLPYLEGVRFRDENQHESTWLKGVRWVIVVGDETPLTVDGTPTSLGRMMLRETAMLTETGSPALFKSPLDNRLYRAIYTHTYPSAPLRGWLAQPAATRLRITTAGGETIIWEAPAAAGAALLRLDDQLLLASSALPRREWVRGVVAINSE